MSLQEINNKIITPSNFDEHRDGLEKVMSKYSQDTGFVPEGEVSRAFLCRVLIMDYGGKELYDLLHGEPWPEIEKEGDFLVLSCGHDHYGDKAPAKIYCKEVRVQIHDADLEE